MAWRMVIELVAGLVIGFGIGYGLDCAASARCPLAGAVHIAGLRGRGEDDAPHRPRRSQDESGGRHRPATTRDERGQSVDRRKLPAALPSTRWTSSSSRPLFGGRRRCTGTRLTNVTLWMAIAVLAIFAAAGRRHPRPRHGARAALQSVAELAYGFVYKMVEDVAGKDGLVFFPYIMTLFMFIVFANFLACSR